MSYATKVVEKTQKTTNLTKMSGIVTTRRLLRLKGVKAKTENVKLKTKLHLKRRKFDVRKVENFGSRKC